MENFKQIKTYEDALKVLGREDFSYENLYTREIARRKLEIIIEAMNDGWKPDWENASQSKWYPYFYRSSTGLRYSSALASPSYADADLDARLCFKSGEIADYAGQQFLDLYEETFLG